MKKSLLVACAAAFLGLSAAHAANGVPPAIPHPIKDYLPITAEQIKCTMCHQMAAKGQEAQKTQIPVSHQDDKGGVQAMFLQCTMCHQEKPAS